MYANPIIFYLAELCAALGRSPLDLDLGIGFIANGGNSIIAIRLAATYRTCGFQVSVGEILTCESLRQLLLNISASTSISTGSLTNYMLSQSHASQKTVDRLQDTNSPGSSVDQATHWNVDNDEDLTETQLGFVHGSLKHPGVNFIVHTETYPSEHMPAVQKAWETVIEFEPIFQQSSILRYVSKEKDRGSSITVTHLPTETEGSGLAQLTWTVHHALIDGYSASLVFNKVLRLANGAYAYPGPPFTELSQALHRYKQSQRPRAEAFWTAKSNLLASAAGNLLLPSTSGAELEVGRHISTCCVKTSIASLCGGIRILAQELGVTTAALFNAAWALTLSACTDSDAVVFGAVLSGRSLNLPGILETVGPMVNTLPFLFQITRSETLEELIRSAFHGLIELESFQWTSPEYGGFKRNYESALSVQFDLSSSDQSWPIHPLNRETTQTSEIPLAVMIDAEGLVDFCYHEHRFSKDSVERIAATFCQAVSVLQLNPRATVNEAWVNLIPNAHRNILKSFGGWFSSRSVRGSVSEDLVTLFEKQARNNAHAVAVEKGDAQMTYEQMDKASSAVALHLRQIISPGEVVCVHSDRSLNWLVAIFAVLKAGGTYCSLDPGLPHGLRDRIYELSGANIFLTPCKAGLQVQPPACLLAMVVEDLRLANPPTLGHRQFARPNSQAYVCFTSGSTGTPKGVLCTHEGLVAFQSTLEVRLFASPGVRVANLMSVAFDGSIHEVFSALTHGATLVLPHGSDPFAHLKLVDTVILTPSLASVLNPVHFKNLRWVYLVGEPVPPAVCDIWATHVSLFNMYGPTEGTCGATIKRLIPHQPVTIGSPNPTTRIYILDSSQRLSPLGVPGEIYLAGIQVARGYLGLPAATSERFLPDSISDSLGEQMYRTGDRGYWNQNGEIVCLGRNDREIKLRGYRLDLNDLEIRIAAACPELLAVAVARRGEELVAMVRPSIIDETCIRLSLAKVLPSYGIPRIIIAVDQIPTTAAGKVNYKAIAAESPVATPMKTEPKVETTEAEKAIIAAFRAVLCLDKSVEIAPHTSFLDLGGHSLQQIRLLRHLSKMCSKRISLQMILEQPTVKDLAKVIQDSSSSSISKKAGKEMLLTSMHHCFTVGDDAVSPIEKDWLHKYNLDYGSSSFNVCFSTIFDKTHVDRSKLIDAWNSTLARHKLLSCRYTMRRLNETRRMYSSCPPRVQCVRSLDLWQEVNRPFEVDKADPIRVLITGDRLTVVISHIIADFTALSILLRDASLLYNGQHLEEVPPQYSAAVVWYEKPNPRSIEFWTSYLESCPSNPPLLGRQMNRTHYRGTSALSIIDAQIFKSLLQYSTATKITLQQLTLACMAACLDTTSASTDIVIGAPYINRNTVHDLETFGLFLEPIPVRIRYQPGDDAVQSEPTSARPPISFAHSVQLSSQAALTHAVPWNQLLQHLHIEPDYPTHPLFDVMVSMHDYRPSNSESTAMRAPGYEPSFLWSEGAKFKLMCEFVALSDATLVLRLEYDGVCVLPADVALLQRKIPLALALLAAGVPHDELKAKLAEVDLTWPYNPADVDSLFGRSYREICHDYEACYSDL